MIHPLATKRISLKLIACAVISMAALLAWLFVGFVHSHFDEERQVSFFVKRFPTFKVEFYNPDGSESDYEPFNELSPEKKQALTDYCAYKFGVTSGQAEAIENCRKNPSGQLK